MAELDEKLLKSLDEKLKSMEQTLVTLGTTIQTVSSESKLSLTQLIDVFKGKKLADLMGIQDAVGQVSNLKNEIELLKKSLDLRGFAKLTIDEETGKERYTVPKGKEFKTEQDERDVINRLAQSQQKLHDLMLSDEQILEKIIALVNKAATDAQKAADAQEKAFNDAVKQQQELAKKYAEYKKLRDDTFGGRSYGKLTGAEKVQWTEMSSSLEKIKAQQEEIEKTYAGSMAEGKRRFDEETALNKAKEDQRQKELAEKKQAAEEEKRILKELADEEKKTAAEKVAAEKEKIAAGEDLNKSYNKMQEQEDKIRRQQRVSESKAAYTAQENALKRQVEIQNQLIAKSRQIAKEEAAINIERKKAKAENRAPEISREQAAIKALKEEMRGLAKEAGEINKEYKGTLKTARDLTKSKWAYTQAENARMLKKSLKDVQKTAESMMPILQRLASAFGVAFSVRGLVQFGKKLIETRGEFEMQFVAMKQIIGDTDAATKIWNQTMQQALKSPFKAMQLVTYTKQLAAYRIETEKLFDTTKRLADISAGLGVDMGRLILAYGQVKSANFLRASEVRQFTEAGVNIAGNLAQYFSELEGRAVSTAEVMERITKRMVSFADVEAIFKRMTDEGGEFFNMQEVQANTVKGQIMKLHDAYDQMLNTIGESKQGAIRDMVDVLNDLVKNWRNVVIYIQGSAVAMGVLVAKAKILPVLSKSFKEAGGSVVFFNRNLRKAGITLDDYIVRQKMATRGASLFGKAMRGAAIAGANLEKVLRMIPSGVWWVAVIEGITILVEKLTEARREANRLQKDLAEIRVENSKKASDDIKNYDTLINRMNELNRGSVERKNVIDKINSQYGKYIGFLVTEATTLPELADAQERVIKNIRENARAMAEEASAQRIQENFIKKEQDIVRGNWFSRLYDQSYLQYKEDKNELKEIALSLDEASKFTEYYRSKIEGLTDKQVEEFANDREKLLDATTEWLKAFLGIESKDIQLSGFGFESLADLYIEEEKRMRDAREKISLELGGLTKDQQDVMKSLSSSVSDAIKKLSYAGEGEEINIEDLGFKFVVPTDLGDKNGIFEAIKQEINKRKDDFIIDLKLNWGYITEEQAEEAKNAGKSTGNIFVDAVNKEVEKGILQSKGISMSYSDLVSAMLDPSKSGNWDDATWKNVNESIDLINRNLITSSDIVNGISTYTKELSANLANGRVIIDEAVKKQNLIVDGTEEEVKKAQEAVDKARERYKWLLRIAKLLGIDTKAQDEIVEEQGYDLSVGQFRLAAAQSAFMEKFGKASNTYGKQLSQIGVTENMKDIADAYHKQSEELDALVKNQEKALENETNLTEEQKDNAKATIESLTEQKTMAEFLAEFFGYVPKKTTPTNQNYKSISTLISLLKEMNSEYDKLAKSAYGYAKSQQKVTESFSPAFKEIFGFLGIDISQADTWSKKGLADTMKMVIDKMDATKAWGKFGKDGGKEARDAFVKAWGQEASEVDIEMSVRIREDFSRQMEKAFGDYELTLELEKLNISQEAIRDLFPAFNTETLGDIQDAMKVFYEEQGASFDQEDLEEYKKWSDKIESEILKYRKDRAKEYSRFLEKEYSERAKTEMQYAKDVAFVTANFSGQQQKNILEGLDEKFKKDINELNWKSFKESSFYVEMMDDLSSVPIEYMRLMLSKIEEILKNPEALPPRALKEAINARQKIIEAQMDFDQIAVMRQSMSEIREAANDKEVGGNTWLQTKKNLDEQQKAQAEKLASIEQEIRDNEKLQGQLKGLEDRQKAYNDARKALSSEDIVALGDLNDPQSLINENEAKLAVYQKQLADLKNAEGEASSETKDSIAILEAKVQETQIAIGVLEKYKEALRGLGAYEVTEGGQAALQAQGVGMTSTSVGGKITQGKRSAEDVTKRLSVLQKWQKAFTNFNNAFAKFNKNAADMVSRLGALSTAAFDLYEALGGETDAMTEAWKEFGSTITTTITEALTMIPALVVGFVTAGTAINAAMGIIGLIAEAIQLVLVLITGLAKLHDAGYQKEIDNLQKKIDELTRAYERLEKQIDKTFESLSYMQEYSAMTANLYAQVEALNAQYNAEEAKKNSDKDKLQDYKDKIQDAEDELEELKQKQIEVFGGIGEEGYRDAAQGFVDAWKSAFLETGDGLQGLQDHFDEFLNDWFVKQATMRVAGKMLEPVFRDIDAAVDKYGEGGTSVMSSELEKIREKFGIIAPELSNNLEELYRVFGLGGEGSLSGLAAGIQGMSEEQANILEAYWNSVRGYTASIDMNVSRIAQILGAGGDSVNPMLQQVTSVAQNTAALVTLVQNLTKAGHGKGGVGLKVFVN